VDPYAWAWDLDAILVVAVLGTGYALGTQGTHVPRRRLVCFASGLALILAVSITPVQTIALHYLLSMHLLQNVVMAEWAPLLCVLGVPPAVASRLGRLPLARALTWPPLALGLWLGVYFFWHLPFAYDAALRHQATLLHLEHASYFASGVLMWWPVFQDSPRRLTAGQRTGYLFAAFVLSSPLGLLIGLVPDPLYSFYEEGPGLWGLDPLTDQQIAGMTMSLEQAFVFFAVLVYFFLRALGSEERREQFRAA
jgi:cytochrome c oxidase assembly factor CtaG